MRTALNALTKVVNNINDTLMLDNSNIDNAVLMKLNEIMHKIKDLKTEVKTRM